MESQKRECPLCKSSYHTIVKLNSHMLHTHGTLSNGSYSPMYDSELKRWKCKFCGTLFKNYYTARAHLNIKKECNNKYEVTYGKETMKRSMSKNGSNIVCIAEMIILPPELTTKIAAQERYEWSRKQNEPLWDIVTRVISDQGYKYYK